MDFYSSVQEFNTTSVFLLWSACWDWRQHPDEDHGVEERGGHVGHQSQLPEEVRSISLHHHPGTEQTDTKPWSVLSVSVCCCKYSDLSKDKNMSFSSQLREGPSIPHPFACCKSTRRVYYGSAAYTCQNTDGIDYCFILNDLFSEMRLLPCFSHQQKWINLFSWGRMFRQSYCHPTAELPNGQYWIDK